MKVLVCNLGSTSLKFQLLDMPSEQRLARGHIERIGSSSALVRFWKGSELVATREAVIPGQREAVRLALDFLLEKKSSVADGDDIEGVGFKCVQAGEKNGSVLLDEDVLSAMKAYQDLAPAHNPPYLQAISMFRDLMPETPLVGVFEPGFHINAPEYAKVYGVPWDWYEDLKVKKYGYHGASHRYVTAEVCRILQLSGYRHKIISCHLGGSSSLCAFQNGVAVDTSMGFTPQSGLIQGTRIGDLDPYVLPFVMKKKGISLEEALKECSTSSGLAGLSGTSGDMRDINDALRQGSRRAQLARDKFVYDIKRYVGEFLVLMEGVDAIAFAGGIGRQDADLRCRVLSSLEFLGLQLDHDRNLRHESVVTKPSSAIQGLVIETDEEVVVARETIRVIAD